MVLVSVRACDLRLSSFSPEGGLSLFTPLEQIGCGGQTRTAVLLAMNQAGYLLPHSALAPQRLKHVSLRTEPPQGLRLSARFYRNTKEEALRQPPSGRSKPLAGSPILYHALALFVNISRFTVFRYSLPPHRPLHLLPHSTHLPTNIQSLPQKPPQFLLGT